MMQKVFTKGTRPKINKMCPDIIAKFFPRMWDADVSKRPESEEVIEVLAKALTDISGDEELLDNTSRTRASLDVKN